MYAGLNRDENNEYRAPSRFSRARKSAMGRIAFLAQACLLCQFLAAQCNSNPGKPAGEDPFLALSWLDGSWVHGDKDSSIEEHWRQSGAGLVGMFREVKKGRSTFFEIMAIEAEGRDIIMRIRHFGPGLKAAWEEKSKPMTFRLGERAGDSATFDGLEVQAGERLLYRLIDNDTLEITGEFLHGGKKRVEVFRMERKPCRQDRGARSEEQENGGRRE